MTPLIGDGGALAAETAAHGNFALRFDGIDDHVLIPDNASLDIQNAITIEAWLGRSGGGESAAWASKYDRGRSWDIHHDDFYISRSPEENDALRYPTPNDRWVYVAAVYDGSLPGRVYRRSPQRYSLLARTD